MVCYIRKYVIILGDIPVDVPPTKILGDVSPASPAGLTPVPGSALGLHCMCRTTLFNIQSTWIGSLHIISGLRTYGSPARYLDRVGWGQDVRSWADFQSVAVADPEDRDRGREGGLGCR